MGLKSASPVQGTGAKVQKRRSTRGRDVPDRAKDTPKASGLYSLTGQGVKTSIGSHGVAEPGRLWVHRAQVWLIGRWRGAAIERVISATVVPRVARRHREGTAFAPFSI